MGLVLSGILSGTYWVGGLADCPVFMMTGYGLNTLGYGAEASYVGLTIVGIGCIWFCDTL